ncbi:MAG: hypothetical protein HRU36_02635 [Rickettsiales bacterium]|nr:hypothetical protein [Rickettsiales bacterium]
MLQDLKLDNLESLLPAKESQGSLEDSGSENDGVITRSVTTFQVGDRIAPQKPTAIKLPPRIIDDDVYSEGSSTPSISGREASFAPPLHTLGGSFNTAAQTVSRVVVPDGFTPLSASSGADVFTPFVDSILAHQEKFPDTVVYGSQKKRIRDMSQALLQLTHEQEVASSGIEHTMHHRHDSFISPKAQFGHMPSLQYDNERGQFYIPSTNNMNFPSSMLVQQPSTFSTWTSKISFFFSYNTKKLYDVSQEQIQEWSRNTIFGSEIVDTVANTILCYQVPTHSHAKKITDNLVNVHILWNGFDFTTIGLTSALTAYKLHEEGIWPAIKYVFSSFSMISMAYPIINTMFPFGGYAITGYKIIMASFAVWNSIATLHSLYQNNYGDNRGNYELESYQAKLNFIEWLADNSDVEFFKIKAQKYEDAIKLLDTNRSDKFSTLDSFDKIFETEKFHKCLMLKVKNQLLWKDTSETSLTDLSRAADECIKGYFIAQKMLSQHNLHFEDSNLYRCVSLNVKAQQVSQADGSPNMIDIPIILEGCISYLYGPVPLGGIIDHDVT